MVPGSGPGAWLRWDLARTRRCSGGWAGEDDFNWEFYSLKRTIIISNLLPGSCILAHQTLDWYKRPETCMSLEIQQEILYLLFSETFLQPRANFQRLFLKQYSLLCGCTQLCIFMLNFYSWQNQLTLHSTFTIHLFQEILVRFKTVLVIFVTITKCQRCSVWKEQRFILTCSLALSVHGRYRQVDMVLGGGGRWWPVCWDREHRPLTSGADVKDWE